MNKIIARAGIEPWPKTFQNLRSTRETELFKLTGNVKAVCTWICYSPDVSMKDSAQITEADTREAVKLSVLTDGKKRVRNRVQMVQKRVQNITADSRIKSHEVKTKRKQKACFCDENQQKTKACDSMRDTGLLLTVGRAGFEPAKAHANGFTAHP